MGRGWTLDNGMKITELDREKYPFLNDMEVIRASIGQH